MPGLQKWPSVNEEAYVHDHKAGVSFLLTAAGDEVTTLTDDICGIVNIYTPQVQVSAMFSEAAANIVLAGGKLLLAQDGDLLTNSREMLDQGLPLQTIPSDCENLPERIAGLGDFMSMLGVPVAKMTLNHVRAHIINMSNAMVPRLEKI